MTNVSIAHIITSTSVGGAEQTLKKLLLSDKNYFSGSFVISLMPIGPIGEELITEGFRVYALNFKGISSSFFSFFKLLLILRKTKPDIAQTWMYHSDLIGGVAAKIIGIKKIIWGIRRTELDKKFSLTYFFMKCSSFLSRKIPDVIICVADSAKKKHITYGYCKEKMIVIPNGIDVLNFDKQEAHKNKEIYFPNEKRLIIGCIGRYHYDKGQDLLLDAASELIKNFSNISFALVGRNCEKSNFLLSQKIHELKIEDHVHLLGERKDIPQILSTFDIYCMPSRTEGFPNGLAEAMASRLPCAATDVGDSRKLSGETVIFANTASKGEIFIVLKKLILMESVDRQELGIKARSRIEDNFSLPSMLEKFKSVYSELLK